MEICDPPAAHDTVQVLMSERLARRFEELVLGRYSHLSAPILFGEDDVPTYIIEVS